MQKVTVYDIASELGISPSTVSRVLNNSSLISDERSRQIRECADRLGYRKRTIKKHVGRVILNIHLFLPKTDNQMTHFFYNISELIDSIQQGFGDVRLNFLTRVNDGNLEFLERKKTGHIDGCVFAFTSPSVKLQKELKDRTIPFILLNRQAKFGNFICYDIPAGIRVLAEKLFDAAGSGLKPCFLGFSKLQQVSDERFDAAEEAFQNLEIPFSRSSVLTLDSFEEVPGKALDWVLEGGFNGVIAFNDLVALSFLQAALARGIKVPGKIMLTGFDDSPIQTLLDRRIDTISLSIPELGRMAGEWLKGNIIDRDDRILREVLPVDYIPGQTIS